MKILTMPQGSAQWQLVRLGIPTCSRADELITPAKLEPSKSARKYMLKLLAEWLAGYPMDDAGNGYTDRGTGMEAEARAAYELETGAEVRQVGFLMTDCGRFGGSPDSLVGEDGGLEIKCPALHTMIGYTLDPDSLVSAYRGQCQALMYVSGRPWWDLYAYNPQLPSIRRRVERDEKYVAAFDKALSVFLTDLEAARAKLAPYRSQMQEAA